MSGLDHLLRAIQAHGLHPPSLIPDGQLHRCPTTDRPQARNGWVICWPDGRGAVCGDWRGDWSRYVSRNGAGPLSQADRERIDQARETARRAREADHQAAAERAAALYAKSRPASADHPYLQKKRVAPCPGLRQSGKLLVLPVMDESWKAISLQYIAEDGSKRFLRGGAVGGGFIAIKGADTIGICEGYATGATIHAAVGWTVLVAFTAGNLQAVAEMARKKYPSRQIVVCADNDLATEGNPGLKCAIAAAKAVDGMVALPEYEGLKCDFNDVFVARGLEVVKAQLEAAQAPGPEQAPADEWPDLIRFDSTPVPRIPCSILPGIAGQFAEALAQELQVPDELAVMATFGGVNLAVTNCVKSIEVRRGYKETPNTYADVSMDPAERKSGTLEKAYRPHRIWEFARCHAMREEIAQKRSERRSQEKLIEQRRNRLSRIKEPAEREQEIRDIAKAEASLERVPAPPQLFTEDCTPERLGTLLMEQGEVMGVVSAEGAWFDTFSRYSNGPPKIDLALKAHCGESFRDDRMGREPVILESPRMHVMIIAQPEVMRELGQRPGFRGKGMIARHMLVLPHSFIGERSIDPPPMPPHVEQGYDRLIKTLLDLRGANLELSLSPGAYENWKEFAQEVEHELRDGGEFANMRDWAGKLPGLAVRIAGTLHAVEYDLPGNRIISGETMAQALEFAALLSGHAKEALGIMGADPSRTVALKILS